VNEKVAELPGARGVPAAQLTESVPMVPVHPILLDRLPTSLRPSVSSTGMVRSVQSVVFVDGLETT
jgi:hypothetical protein